MIPADEVKFADVNPVTEMVPEESEIPEPAVKPSWIPKPAMSALVIFNFAKSIAAPEATSALAMVDFVAKDPNPKFVLAPAAVVAPVPPLAIATSVPLQTPLVIVPTLVKLEVTTLLASVVPDKVPASAIIDAVPAAVKRPLLSTVNVGMAVVEP